MWSSFLYLTVDSQCYMHATANSWYTVKALQMAGLGVNFFEFLRLFVSSDLEEIGPANSASPSYR